MKEPRGSCGPRCHPAFPFPGLVARAADRRPLFPVPCRRAPRGSAGAAKPGRLVVDPRPNFSTARWISARSSCTAIPRSKSRRFAQPDQCRYRRVHDRPADLRRAGRRPCQVSDAVEPQARASSRRQCEGPPPGEIGIEHRARPPAHRGDPRRVARQADQPLGEPLALAGLDDEAAIVTAYEPAMSPSAAVIGIIGRPAAAMP